MGVGFGGDQADTSECSWTREREVGEEEEEEEKWGGEKDRKSPCFQLPFSGARFSLPPSWFFARPFWSQLT